MAIVNPFKAVRAPRDKVALVSSKSHEIYATKKLKAKLKFNPYTFLHVINPGYKFNKDINGEERFELVHNRYLEFKENGIFKQDQKPAYYIYQKQTSTDNFCGIIAATSVKDYDNNIIKKHEGTLETREILFEHYLSKTGFNAEPVLLTFDNNTEISSILEKYKSQRAEYEFSTSDTNLHVLWIIDDENDVNQLKKAFKKIDTLYIADGHHRSSSSSLLAKRKASENKNHSGTEDYNYFMSFLIPEEELKISEFNRFVKDLNGLTAEEFLIRLDTVFRIENKGDELYVPSKKHHFSMYLNGSYYALRLRKTKQNFKNTLTKLDTEILQDLVLAPILGIKNIRTDKRISYSAKKNNSLFLKKQVDSNEFAVAFGLVPVTINEIKQIADEGLQMSPKSTYIEPKLRSALTIYEF